MMDAVEAWSEAMREAVAQPLDFKKIAQTVEAVARSDLKLTLEQRLDLSTAAALVKSMPPHKPLATFLRE